MDRGGDGHALPSGARAAPTEGDFTNRHVGSRSRVLSWSHRSRFELAREILQPYAGGRILDYGSGDGTFLASVADLFPARVGADIWEEQLEMCRQKYADDPDLRFINPAESREIGAERYDVVTCMEVLEHCPPDAFDLVIENLARLVADSGVVLVSVPIETGPSLLVKQSVRTFAALRGVGPYRQANELYRPAELVRMLFAGERTAIERPIYWYGLHGHKGFNWRQVRRRLAERFTIERRLFSPVPIFGPLLNSQVWFECRPHSARTVQDVG